MTLFAVDVPLVAKKVRFAPKALAAIACASPITPFGSMSESSIGTTPRDRRRTRARP